MGQNPNEQIQRMLKQQDIAFGPGSGTLLQKLIPGVCKHKEVRCCHGDERFVALTRCLVCRRRNVGSWPIVCFFTGLPHRWTAPDA